MLFNLVWCMFMESLIEYETVTLSCNYESTATNNYLHWYRQYPGSRPEYLLMIYPASKAVSHATPPFPRLNVTENNKTVDLIISSAAVSDSALYYCALRPTVTGNPATLYKNILHHSSRVTCVSQGGAKPSYIVQKLISMCVRLIIVPQRCNLPSALSMRPPPGVCHITANISLEVEVVVVVVIRTLLSQLVNCFSSIVWQYKCKKTTQHNETVYTLQVNNKCYSRTSIIIHNNNKIIKNTMMSLLIRIKCTHLGKTKWAKPKIKWFSQMVLAWSESRFKPYGNDLVSH
uniref:Ig-like domain-containing protein n=1 Tax=Pygocentrus nattereri TaxID=42514 RepID=A0A3B4CE42_PYGNA